MSPSLGSEGPPKSSHFPTTSKGKLISTSVTTSSGNLMWSFHFPQNITSFSKSYTAKKVLGMNAFGSTGSVRRKASICLRFGSSSIFHPGFGYRKLIYLGRAHRRLLKGVLFCLLSRYSVMVKIRDSKAKLSSHLSFATSSVICLCLGFLLCETKIIIIEKN